VPTEFANDATAPTPHLLWVVGSNGQILRYEH
jgi:hypothetical protein